MKRLLPLVVLALGPALYADAALGKDRVPTPEVSRKLVLDYAMCIVRRSHDKAARSLLLNADNNTIKRDFSRLIEGGCLRSDVASIGFDADLFRYSLANALVAFEFAASGPADFSDRLLLTHLQAPTQADLDTALAKARSSKERDEASINYQKAQSVAALSRYGECVTRSDPGGARLWVLSTPDTRDEEAIIDALRPSFAACLKDGKITFSKTTLRGTVALNYYRLAHAPTQSSSVKAD
jgi:hypothetical protein